jgi:hypothetical protein
LQPNTRSKNTQMYVEGWNGMMNFGGQLETGYPVLRVYTQTLVKASEQFTAVIRPDDLDATWKQATFETDVDAQQKLVWDLEKMLIDKYCLINPIYVSYSCGATSPAVHDLKLYDPWIVRWPTEDAWLSK